jgi:hypothetical protein
MARKNVANLSEALLDALAEELGSELAGVDYELHSSASDRELAGALGVAGIHLLTGVISIPPVKAKKERSATKQLLRTTRNHLDRSLYASRFLAHALVRYEVLYDELSTELSGHLDFPTTPPAPIQFRAQGALTEHMPITEGETSVIERAAEGFAGVRNLPPDSDFQMAFGWRGTDYQLATELHAISLILLDDYEDSQIGKDNSGYSNLPGHVKTPHAWAFAQKRAFEMLHAISFDEKGRRE